jgi:hypothetical protein
MSDVIAFIGATETPTVVSATNPLPVTAGGSASSLPVGQAILPVLGSLNAAVSGEVASGAHKVTAIEGRNTTGTLYYLQLFDATTLPTNGTTALASAPVGIGVSSSPTIGGYDWTPNFYQSVNGVFLVWSTTDVVLTVASSAAGLVAVAYGI